MTRKMQKVTETATDVLDIWRLRLFPSLLLIWRATPSTTGFVEAVYRSDDDRFDHVLVMTMTKNIFLTVVIDLAHASIYGHRLLDLNQEYGLS